MLVVKSIKPKNEGLEDNLLMAHAILSIIGKQNEDFLDIDEIYYACRAAKGLLPTPDDLQPH